MATFKITAPADVAITPRAWGMLQADQKAVSSLAAALAAAQAKLAKTSAEANHVFNAIVQRAGGSLGNAQVTGIAANDDGSITITTNP